MKISKLTPEQKATRKRIVEISYQSGLSHLGSCFTAIDIIDAIYKAKSKSESFVLSSGHAGVALYVILEKHNFLKSEVIKELHIHPDRNVALGIDVSAGSLGQGLPIALGMALANKNRRVYCLVTDGECAEGSIWESLRIVYDRKVNNLIILINANGWGAYDPISLPVLLKRIKGFGFRAIVTDGHSMDKLLSAINTAKNMHPSVIFAKTNVGQFPFLKGQDAHYYLMQEKDYTLALEMLR